MSKQYVVYEVWTTARVVEADDETDAYTKAEPITRPGMNLCNWHVVPIDPPALTVEQQRQALDRMLNSEPPAITREERKLRLHLADPPQWLDKD